MASSSFNQLFHLPDGLVCSTVIPLLKMKDLSHLDEATTNKAARPEHLSWVRGFSENTIVIPSTKPSFLRWIVARNMTVSMMQVDEDTDGAVLQQYDGSNLDVDVFIVSQGKKQSGAFPIMFLMTLKSVQA